ncbi:MAG: hypothetical protein RL065_540 [Bacteroidota bacterium]|jgi:hypothetical protein
MRYISIVIIFFSLSFECFAQSIGIPKSNSKILVEADDTIPHLEIKKWVGKKLLFLPIIDSKQMYDYVSFSGGTGFNGRPIYANCVDQTATILSVDNDSLNVGEFIVKIKMNTKAAQIYYGRTFNGSLTRVVLQDDIELAEKLMKGKVFWMKSDFMYRFNQTKERNEIKYGFRFKKVRVTHVELGFDDNALYTLTLSDEMGETGTLYINVSNNNIDNSMINTNLLSKYFFKKNPKKIYQWSDEVWQTIENKEIYKGMTEEQAKLSWGDPDFKTKTKDDAIKYKYNNGSYFVIKDGKVTELKQ